MAFIAGTIIGGLITTIIVIVYLKGQYKIKIAESYNKGYKDGQAIEKRAIFDYIDRLNNDANARVYDTELP